MAEGTVTVRVGIDPLTLNSDAPGLVGTALTGSMEVLTHCHFGPNRINQTEMAAELFNQKKKKKKVPHQVYVLKMF